MNLLLELSNCQVLILANGSADARAGVNGYVEARGSPHARRKFAVNQPLFTRHKVKTHKDSNHKPQTHTHSFSHMHNYV